jgi:hypothetical protein
VTSAIDPIKKRNTLYIICLWRGSDFMLSPPRASDRKP